MKNEREMRRVKELKGMVRKEIIKRKRFRMFFRPIITCSYIFIPVFLMACLIDAFVPYMPNNVAYIGLAITCVGVFLSYRDVMHDVKVDEAKTRYKRYISRLN